MIITARELEKASSAAVGLTNTTGRQLDINDEVSVARAAAAVPELDVLINPAAA